MIRLRQNKHVLFVTNGKQYRNLIQALPSGIDDINNGRNSYINIWCYEIRPTDSFHNYLRHFDIMTYTVTNMNTQYTRYNTDYDTIHVKLRLIVKIPLTELQGFLQLNSISMHKMTLSSSSWMKTIKAWQIAHIQAPPMMWRGTELTLLFFPEVSSTVFRFRNPHCIWLDKDILALILSILSYSVTIIFKTLLQYRYSANTLVLYAAPSGKVELLSGRGALPLN